MVKIRIPATSANLGSGFDALGVALNMYNYVYMREDDKITVVSRDQEVPTDESNLIYKTVKEFYNLCGKDLKGLFIEQTSNIPQARGLGSSSACVIAGLLGANEMLGRPLSQDDIINIAAKIEGHPDNSTPALLGGLITAVFDGKEVHYVKQEVNSDLKFAVIVPDFELKTEQAREILPKNIDHMDARYNLSRSALMAVSLYSGKYENLRVACDDKLHQPYRLPLIPHAKEVIEMCYENGAYANYISGAGSSLMAIVDDKIIDFQQKTRDCLDNMGFHNWGLHMLSIDNKGAIFMLE